MKCSWGCEKCLCRAQSGDQVERGHIRKSVSGKVSGNTSREELSLVVSPQAGEGGTLREQGAVSGPAPPAAPAGTGNPSRLGVPFHEHLTGYRTAHSSAVKHQPDPCTCENTNTCYYREHSMFTYKGSHCLIRPDPFALGRGSWCSQLSTQPTSIPHPLPRTTPSFVILNTGSS